jgi:hypothetical protein
VIYAVSGIAAILALARFGLEIAVLGWVARTFLLLPLQIHLLRRMLQVSYRKVLGPVVAPAVAALVMAASVTGVVWYLGTKIDNAALVAIAVATGVIVYAICIAVMARDLMRFVMHLPRTLSAAKSSGAPAEADAADLSSGSKFAAGA